MLLFAFQTSTVHTQTLLFSRLHVLASTQIWLNRIQSQVMHFSKELEEIEHDFPSHNVAVLFQPLFSVFYHHAFVLDKGDLCDKKTSSLKL